MDESPNSASSQRLESWKEIAAFFGRDERTVRRWEKESGMPVYRVPGGAKGRVFAYANELSEWLRTPQNPVGAQPAPDAPQPGSSAGSPPASPPAGFRSRQFVAWAWAVLIIVCAGLAVGIFAYRKRHGFSVHAASSAAPRSASPEAENLYLQGRYYWNRRTPQDLNKAVDYFTQSIVHDPGYAPAYVGLADCYNLLREFSAMPPAEAYPRALAAAEKAVELDPNSAEAHTSLAFVSFWGYARVANADREFRRAIELAPDNARAHHWYATYLAECGQNTEALAEIEKARALDPSSTAIMADKAFILACAGRIDEAIEMLKQIEQTDPSFVSAHSYLSGIYWQRQEYKAYFHEARTAAELQHDHAMVKRLEAQEDELARDGYAAIEQEQLREDLKRYQTGEADDYQLAQDYAELGRNAEALRYLENAYEKHDFNFRTVLIDQRFRGLRDDAEFRRIVSQAGFVPPA